MTWNTDNLALMNQTGNPVSTSNPDNQMAPSLGGRQGEDYVAEIHGKWYTAAYRGAVFHYTTPIAGQVIPVLGATSQTAASIYNPLGSGVNLELISFRLGESITTATFVIGSIGFGVLQNVGAGTALPTSGVAPTFQYGTPIGGTAPLPKGKVFTTATLTAATLFLDMGLSTGLTTGQTAGIIEKTFDGSIVIAPGTLLAVQGTVAQTSSYVLGLSWAEWPV